MSKKGCYIIGGILLIAFLLALCVTCTASIILLSGTSTDITSDSVVRESIQSGNVNEKIAVINLEGVIISDSTGVNIQDDMVERVINKLEIVQNDDSFKAVILKVNTPGGTVYDSDKIAKEILKTREAGKTVIALMQESATSGGYYVSAASDKIIASDVTLTGSIGVVTQVIELDGLYDKLGIDVINITNTKGDIKTFENLDDPNSKDTEVLQDVLDDSYDSFISMIDENRDLTREEILAIADGSVFSGKKALELGLVDELGGMDEAVESAKELAGLSNPEIIEFNDPIDFWSEFLGSGVVSSLGAVGSLSSKLKLEPGVYSWYIVAP